MDYQPNIAEQLGKLDAYTGSQYGPVTGLLGKSLMVGLPTYALTRLITPHVSKKLDPHRTALFSAITSTLGAGMGDIGQLGWNISRGQGAGRFTNLNALPGIVPPNAADEQSLNAMHFKPQDYTMVKEEDYHGGGDHAGSLRAGKPHRELGGRGKTKLGTMVKQGNNLGTAPTEGGSFESKPTHEESVSINDVMENHRRKMKGKSQGKNIAYSSSDVQPVIRPSDDEVMNKIVKDGSLNSWVEKAVGLIKLATSTNTMSTIGERIGDIRQTAGVIGSPVKNIMGQLGTGVGQLGDPAVNVRQQQSVDREVGKGQEAKRVREMYTKPMSEGSGKTPMATGGRTPLAPSTKSSSVEKDVHVEFTGRGDGIKSLLRLLVKCDRDGRAGHSFSIKADGVNYQGGWDGDGADRLTSLKINGRRPSREALKKVVETKSVQHLIKDSAMTRYLIESILDKQADYDDVYGNVGGMGAYDTFLPPGTDHRMGIPTHYTAQQIDNDPYMSPQEKSKAMMILANASDGGRPGLISMGDVTRAAIGAGIGYAGASLFGKVLGGIFGGLAPQTQRTLQQTGMVAGMLVNTGVLR